MQAALLRFGLRGKVPPDPFVEPAVEHSHPVVPPLDEDPRQTGAGGLARSGAV